MAGVSVLIGQGTVKAEGLPVLAACMLTGAAAFAQGRVIFANTPFELLTTNRNLTPPFASGNIAPAGQYVAGLFVGPSGSDYSLLTPVGYAVNASVPGRFDGGSPFVLPSPYSGASPIAFQVRAWSIGLGSTWTEVSGKLSQYDGTGNAKASFGFTLGTYFLGSSAIGSTTPAGPLGVPPLLFGTEKWQVRGFALYEVIPIPEPTALALVFLSSAGVFFVRCWKWATTPPVDAARSNPGRLPRQTLPGRHLSN